MLFKLTLLICFSKIFVFLTAGTELEAEYLDVELDTAIFQPSEEYRITSKYLFANCLNFYEGK